VRRCATVAAVFLAVPDSTLRAAGQCEASANGESTTLALLLGRKDLNMPAVLELRAGKPPAGMDYCAFALGVLRKSPDQVVLILLTHINSLPPCETPCNTPLSGWKPLAGAPDTVFTPLVVVGGQNLRCPSIADELL
jgi:hypothetical protein